MFEEQTGYDAACFTADRRLMLTACHMYVHAESKGQFWLCCIYCISILWAFEFKPPYCCSAV